MFIVEWAPKPYSFFLGPYSTVCGAVEVALFPGFRSSRRCGASGFRA